MVDNFFYVIIRSLLCSPWLNLFDQIYFNFITISHYCFFYILKYHLWWQSWISALLLQSLASYDPSEIIIICWFAAQEIFLIIINVEKQQLNIFVETMIHFFNQDFDKCKKHLFETEIFCNIINIFTVTFYKLNASLLNKNILILLF